MVGTIVKTVKKSIRTASTSNFTLNRDASGQIKKLVKNSYESETLDKTYQNLSKTTELFENYKSPYWNWNVTESYHLIFSNVIFFYSNQWNYFYDPSGTIMDADKTYII